MQRTIIPPLVFTGGRPAVPSRPTSYEPLKGLVPGTIVEARDRNYVIDKSPGTLRLQTPKVRGKKARAADKLRRREARRLADKALVKDRQQEQRADADYFRSGTRYPGQ